MKIIFILEGPITSSNINYNYHQRCKFLNSFADLVIYSPQKNYVQESFGKDFNIKRSYLPGKIGFLIYLMLNLLKFRKIDVVITGPSTFNLIGFWVKLILRKKWVIDIWDIPFRDLKENTITKLKRKLQIIIFKPLFQFADMYIVSILPQFQLKEFNLSEKKIKRFQNAIYLEDYSEYNDIEKYQTFTILIQRSQFFSGFGLELMLDAFTIVIEKKIDAQLLIIGKIIPELSSLISRHPYCDKINTKGYISHKSFIYNAQKSHILAIPFPKLVDLEQTYPIKAIEFMAVGRTIVASRLKGIEELIGDAGVLVDPVTPENFAASIIDLYHDESRRKQLEQKARERARLFDAKEKNRLIFKELQKLVVKYDN